MKNILSILAAALMLASCEDHPKADVILYNGHIYTVDSTFSVAEAMAIGGGKVLAIGTTDSIRRMYRSPKNIDLKKQFVYPGFNDAHAHFYWYSVGLNRVDLTGTKSFDEVIERVKAFAAENQVDFLVGRGWDQNDWETNEFPNKEKLDEAFPNIPVFLSRIDGHAALANQMALDYAGITDTSTVEGGVIQKQNGELTGILIDNAVDLVQPPAPRRAEEVLAIQKGQDFLFRKGITSVTDAGLTQQQIELLQALQDSGQLKVRVNVMVADKPELLDHYLGGGIIETERLTVRTFKFYLDGALGSRGALMLRPYADDQDNHGLMLSNRQHFVDAAKRVKDAGWQMAIHAIGDSANRLALEIYQEVFNDTITERRWRIEHAQIVHPDDLELFDRLDVIPSVQPTHATSDMYWAEERLGESRMDEAYPYQRLLQEARVLPLGTDFPVEDIDPMKTFVAAVFRQDSTGFPEDGFRPEEKLSREEALRGMTVWPAYAAFEEGQKGSLEAGKYADIVILDTDLMQADLKEILNAKVLKTFSNGELVFEKKKEERKKRH